MDEHQKQVQQFLREAQRKDPTKFKEVCDKYPVLTKAQWDTVDNREKPAGLMQKPEKEEN